MERERIRILEHSDEISAEKAATAEVRSELETQKVDEEKARKTTEVEHQLTLERKRVEVDVQQRDVETAARNGLRSILESPTIEELDAKYMHAMGGGTEHMPSWHQYVTASNWEEEARSTAKELQELSNEVGAKLSGMTGTDYCLSEWNVKSQDLDINEEMQGDVTLPEYWKEASRHSWTDDEGTRSMGKKPRCIQIDAKGGKPVEKYQLWCNVLHKATTILNLGGRRHDKGESRLQIPDEALICRGMYITISKKGKTFGHIISRSYEVIGYGSVKIQPALGESL